MRYVVLLVVMMAIWRLVDAGVIRWLVVWLWRRVLGGVLSVFGVGRVEDADADDERGSLFATAYRRLSALFGSEGDEAEL